MKKCKLFTLSIFLFFAQGNAQIAYYDAIKLKKLFTDSITPTTYQEAGKILAEYLPIGTTDTTADLVRVNYLASNIFINPTNLLISGNYFNFQSNNFSPSFGNLFQQIGGLDVTAFADGLAKFLVERTKEELNEAFFRKFADFLKYYPEFKTLFPNTNVLVNNFNSWEYSNLLNTLRESFDKDIKVLLSNFIKLKDLTAKNDCPDKKSNNETLCDNCTKRITGLNDFFNSNGGLFLLSAAQIGDGVLQNQKIPDIINSVTQPNFLLGYSDAAHPQTVSDLKNSLQLLNIFSLSLKSNETGRHYITDTEFKLLETDPILQQIYLGLLYQQIANANSGAGIIINSISVISVLTPGNVDGVRNYYTNLYNQTKNLQTAFNNLLTHKLDVKSDLGPDYAVIFETTDQVLQAATSINIINTGLQCPKELVSAFEGASKVFQISHDIAVRNYNAVVVGVLKLISDATADYIKTHADSHLGEFASVFLKYGSFAANVVNSKNSEDIKESIKSFVLPSGSSSLKKHTSFSISLNSYVGFVYGSSKNTYKTKGVNGADTTGRFYGGKSVGIYAPVGVGFNWGLGWRKKNPWSLSAFISLIDVGAIVGYRFITDSGEVNQKFKINLGNILAPGGNLIIGLPNMPLSIGGGVQWVPSLQRDPKSNEFYNLDHSGFRGQVFIAVDLQLLNFHSSKKSLLYPKKQ